MIKNSLWAEITIAGFFYFVGSFFLILNIIKNYNLYFVNDIKDYLGYLAVIVVGLSYVIGVFSNKLINIAEVLTRKLIRRRKEINVKDFTLIYQKGTNRIHFELDFQYSMVVLFKNLIFAIPFVGINFSIWANNNTDLKKLSSICFIFTIVITILMVGVYLFQQKVHDVIKLKIFDVIEKEVSTKE